MNNITRTAIHSMALQSNCFVNVKNKIEILKFISDITDYNPSKTEDIIKLDSKELEHYYTMYTINKVYDELCYLKIRYPFMSEKQSYIISTIRIMGYGIADYIIIKLRQQTYKDLKSVKDIEDDLKKNFLFPETLDNYHNVYTVCSEIRKNAKILAESIYSLLETINENINVCSDQSKELIYEKILNIKKVITDIKINLDNVVVLNNLALYYYKRIAYTTINDKKKYFNGCIYEHRKGIVVCINLSKLEDKEKCLILDQDKKFVKTKDRSCIETYKTYSEGVIEFIIPWQLIKRYSCGKIKLPLVVSEFLKYSNIKDSSCYSKKELFINISKHLKNNYYL